MNIALTGLLVLNMAMAIIAVATGKWDVGTYFMVVSVFCQQLIDK